MYHGSSGSSMLLWIMWVGDAKRGWPVTQTLPMGGHISLFIRGIKSRYRTIAALGDLFWAQAKGRNRNILNLFCYYPVVQQYLSLFPVPPLPVHLSAPYAIGSPPSIPNLIPQNSCASQASGFLSSYRSSIENIFLAVMVKYLTPQ